MPAVRRVTPLAGWSVVAAFLLIGIALLATVWSTRTAVIDASDAVRHGQALAMEQTVRAELADLEGPPTQADLEMILNDHVEAGMRYLAMVEGRRTIVLEAGEARGGGFDEQPIRGRRLVETDGRLRLQVRPFRRLRDGGRQWRVIVELEPIQAAALRDAATLTLGIGVLAALGLLGVAIVLVRREARRNAMERAREHERRLASLGEMSAVLAHEIKNPLASLKGNAQLLASMLPPGEKAKTKAERVVDEAVRLETLTNGLLQFVRTGAIQRAPTDPGAVVRDAAASVKGDISIDTARAPRTWSLDAGRIREVVINLVANAVDAGEPVRVAVYAMDRKLVIEVTDHGPGIPEDQRDKVFEPFVTTKTHGTGLGLAVVRRTVELHGGRVEALSNQDAGARFRVEIPG